MTTRERFRQAQQDLEAAAREMAAAGDEDGLVAVAQAVAEMAVLVWGWVGEAPFPVRRAAYLRYTAWYLQWTENIGTNAPNLAHAMEEVRDQIADDHLRWLTTEDDPR